MIPKKLIDTVDHMLAVTREAGPNSVIFMETKRLFDRLYDAEIYQRLTVAEFAIFTSLVLQQLSDSWDEAERTGKRIITL